MSGLLDRVYQRSPVWLQQLSVASYGVWWYRRRYGKHFRRLVSELEVRDGWSEIQFSAYQESQLDIVLQAAWHSPYYAPLLQRAGNTRRTPPLDALRSLPLLTKETLRTRARELLSGRPGRGTLVYRSSGTTGTPTSIYYTPRFHALETAVPEVRVSRQAGVTHRVRRVMFGVRKVCRFDQERAPFWRFSPVENLAYCSIYHLSREHLPSYLTFLRRFAPAVVSGFPSALFAVAQYALEHSDLPLPAKAIFTTSETVTPRIRETLEAAWRCRVWDRYGAVEGAVFASECEHGRYHTSPDVGIIEILDDAGRPCPPGVVGSLVCTGLQNTLQPLLRYRIGDVASWAEEQQCPCGRQTPVLDGIEGRYEDMCVTADGRRVLRFDTVFKGDLRIGEAQVVQEKLNEFVVNVVPKNGFGALDVESIVENMRLHVGHAQTRVVAVPFIQRTSSGKFRAVVCKLSPEERARAAAFAANSRHATRLRSNTRPTTPRWASFLRDSRNT
jgi:phenylacetate-CoA ligase